MCSMKKCGVVGWAIIVLIVCAELPSLVISADRHAGNASTTSTPTLTEIAHKMWERKLSASKKLSTNEVAHFFSTLKWKGDVELLKLRHGGVEDYLARWGERTETVSLDNIRGLVEDVDSCAKATEVVSFFRRGVVVLRESDAKEFVASCRNQAVGVTTTNTSAPLITGCAFDVKKKLYKVTLVIYEDFNLLRVEYRIPTSGRIECQSEVMVSAPPILNGRALPAPPDPFESKIRDYEKVVDPIVFRAIESLWRDGDADKNGLYRAKLYALDWLIETPDRAAKEIGIVRKAMEDPNIDDRRKQRAAKVLK